MRPQPACGRFQHVEDLLLLLDIAHQVRLVGMAVLAQHPTVKLGAYRLFQVGNALVQLRSALRLGGDSTAIAGAVLPRLVTGYG